MTLQMQRLVRAHTEHGQEPYIKVAIIRVKDMLLAWHRFLVQNTHIQLELHASCGSSVVCCFSDEALQQCYLLIDGQLRANMATNMHAWQ
jgi:hypothetical protein